MQSFARLTVALGAALLLTAATLGTAAAQTVLDFPTWQAEEPGVSTWWKNLIAAYEKKYPDVKINMQQIPFAQFVKQMTVRFAAGTPPDIVHLPSRDFASFADQGWLEPLDDRLKGTDIPANWPPLQADMQWAGKTQGVLLMGYGGMLFYNEKRLKDAGVALPKTPDEWLAAMKATTAADKGLFGLSTITAEHPNMVVEMATWVIGSGADWLKGGKYNFTDPAVVKAIDNWRAVRRLRAQGHEFGDGRQLFIDGKTAFLRDGPWVWGAVEKALCGGQAAAEGGRTAVPGRAGRCVEQPAYRRQVGREEEGRGVELHRNGGESRMAARVRTDRIARAAQECADRGDLTANPHLKVINDEAARAQNLFPVRAGCPRGLQRFRDAGDQIRDANDLHAGSDRTRARGPAAGTRTRASIEMKRGALPG